MKEKTRKPLNRGQKAYITFALLTLIGIIVSPFISKNTKDTIPFGFLFTWTHSCPSGIYHTYKTPLKKGVIVAFCPPMNPLFQEWKKRGYLQETKGTCPGNVIRWMKPIAALPGDTIRLDKTGATINGHHLPNSAPMYEDHQHRPLYPYPFGTYTVKPGQVWLISHYIPDSADGRYFGPLEISRIESPMKMVLPFEKSHASIN